MMYDYEKWLSMEFSRKKKKKKKIELYYFWSDEV